MVISIPQSAADFHLRQPAAAACQLTQHRRLPNVVPRNRSSDKTAQARWTSKHVHEEPYIPSRLARTIQPVRAASSSAAAAAAAVAAKAATEATRAGSKAHDTKDWRSLIVDAMSQHPEQLIKLTLKAKITVSPDQYMSNIGDAAGNYHQHGSSNVAGDDTSDFQSSSSSSNTPAERNLMMPYKQLTMRPVLLKGNKLLQLQLLDARQDTTKNYHAEAAIQQLQQLIQLPWQSASLVMSHNTTSVQISRKGRVLVQTEKSKQAAVGNQDGISSSTSSGISSSSSSTPLKRGLAPVSGADGPILPVSSPAPAAAAASDGTAPAMYLQHDRVKAQPINGSVPDAFLQKIGLQTSDGRIKANMQAKFTQINEFLKLLIHTGELDNMAAAASTNPSNNGKTGTNEDQEIGTAASAATAALQNSSSTSNSGGVQAVHILDCGCGSAHLTFGTFHYLHNVMGLPAHLTGIDTNRALMERSSRYCQELGIAAHAEFHTAAIRNFTPQMRPDIVLALHACDTATDESLALGIRTGAGVIMSVPCCHKDLHRQQQRHQQQQQQQQQQRRRQQQLCYGIPALGSSSSSSSVLFEPLLSHGILRQRLLDLLTDTFRATLLKLTGYRTDAVEFVSTEHTPRNILIRAVKQRRRLPATERAALTAEYRALKQYWGVVPHLEKLLAEAALLQDVEM